MTASLLPGPYAGKQDKTMTFPDYLVSRNRERYAGVLMEDELFEPGGISAHFWVYPMAPAARLQAAVDDCKTKRDVVRWQWDFMPKKVLPQVLHYHLRELLLTGTKDGSALYLFEPETILMLGEIYDAYKYVWGAVAASPTREGELLRRPRNFALRQLAIRKEATMAAIRSGKPAPEAELVDVQARELTWLMNISNDVLTAADAHARKKADGHYPHL